MTWLQDWPKQPLHLMKYITQCQHTSNTLLTLLLCMHLGTILCISEFYLYGRHRHQCNAAFSKLHRGEICHFPCAGWENETLILPFHYEAKHSELSGQLLPLRHAVYKSQYSLASNQALQSSITILEEGKNNAHKVFEMLEFFVAMEDLKANLDPWKRGY